MSENSVPVASKPYPYSVSSARRRARFHSLVAKVIKDMPPEFRQRLENIDIVVADWPTRTQLAKVKIRSRFGLLGLYEGVPHTQRGGGYGMVLPDKITIFQKPIEARCRSWKEVEKEISDVVCHEIAHHFGIEDERLKKIEDSKSRA